MFHVTQLVTGRVAHDPGASQSLSPSRSMILFTWGKFNSTNVNIHLRCRSYSRGPDSVWACRRRCNPSPRMYCKPRHEEGTSLTSAGSWVSVQPSGVRIKSEVGVIETSRRIPPSSGSLTMQNKPKLTIFSIMREIPHIPHCVEEVKA